VTYYSFQKRKITFFIFSLTPAGVCFGTFVATVIEGSDFILEKKYENLGKYQIQWTEL